MKHENGNENDNQHMQQQNTWVRKCIETNFGIKMFYHNLELFDKTNFQNKF